MNKCRYCGGYAKAPLVYCSLDHALEDGIDPEILEEEAEERERFEDWQAIIRSFNP